MPFAIFPSVVIYQLPGDTPVEQLLFGDYIEELNEEKNGWVKVRGRNTDGWVKQEHLQHNQILEINFLDIDHCDGCHIVTPDDKHFVLNAGAGHHMDHFLSWRYNFRNLPEENNQEIAGAIITHPAPNHYMGFQTLFQNKQLRFNRIYHNGIVERANDLYTLGRWVKLGKRKFLIDLVDHTSDMLRLLADTDKIGNKKYLKLMQAAFDQNPAIKFDRLSADMGYIPGFGPEREVSIQVLSPVTEQGGGQRILKHFTNLGKTKSGHAISLMLTIGKLKIFLGGELNIESEDYLLRQYTGIDVKRLRHKLAEATTDQEQEKIRTDLKQAIQEARKYFGADVVRLCYHQDQHFSTEFLQAIHPLVSIISSVDKEKDLRTQPNVLGALGRWSRGEPPLIFNMEGLASAKTGVKSPQKLKRKIEGYSSAMARELDSEKMKMLQQKKEEAIQMMEKSIAVHGLISLRTDGKQAIIAQKTAKPKHQGCKWEVYQLKTDNNGKLQYESE